MLSRALHRLMFSPVLPPPPDPPLCAQRALGSVTSERLSADFTCRRSRGARLRAPHRRRSCGGHAAALWITRAAEDCLPALTADSSASRNSRAHTAMNHVFIRQHG